MHIGENIKYFRRALHLTQQQLAEKASISRSYLADVEKNRYNPSLDTMKKIAEALGIHPSELLDKEIETDRKPENYYKTVNNGLVKEVETNGYEITKDKQQVQNMDVPEIFTDAEEAKNYVKRHKIFASEGFDVIRLTDEEILEFANALLDQMKMVSYKYKR